MTGTALGHERSMKAIHVSEEAQDQLLRMACMAAICLKNYDGYQIISASTTEKTQELD